MKKILSSLLFASLGAGVVAGCNNVKAPLYGRSDPYDARQIQFGSEDLEKSSAVGKPDVTRDSFGLLHVTVPIRSASNYELHVDSRITFFRDGQRTETLGPQTVNLKANVPQYVTFNSTSPADNFQIDFDYAK